MRRRIGSLLIRFGRYLKGGDEKVTIVLSKQKQRLGTDWRKWPFPAQIALHKRLQELQGGR